MTAPQAPFPAAEQIIGLIPAGVSLDVLREKRMVPLRQEGAFLVIGAPDVSVLPDAQLLAMGAGSIPQLEYHPEEAIGNLIRTLYDLKSGVGQDTLNAIESVDDLSVLARQEVMSDSVDAPVIRHVNGILLEAVKERATDIHIEPFEEKVVVRYRVDGVLEDRHALT